MTTLQLAMIHAEELLQSSRKYVRVTHQPELNATKLEYGYIMSNGERDRIIGTKTYYSRDEDHIEYCSQVHA